MTFTLSLISTVIADVKLITKNKADAQDIINKTDLFVSEGDFESVDFQFSITDKEFNNFDRFSGASYEPVEKDTKWSTIDGIEYIMTSKPKDGNEESVVAHTKHDVLGDDLLATDVDDYFDDSDDLSGIGEGFGSGYNSDEQW